MYDSLDNAPFTTNVPSLVDIGSRIFYEPTRGYRESHRFGAPRPTYRQDPLMGPVPMVRQMAYMHMVPSLCPPGM